MTESRGYIIMAIGEHYERCAQLLTESLHHWHPDAAVRIVTEQDLPLGDKRRSENSSHQENDWQVARVSPWHETIKLEADMLITGPIDHWWQLFRHRDLVISTGCRDYYNAASSNRSYRKVFDDNHLPDVYNAITYWRQSETAQEFWRWVRRIFAGWDQYRRLLKFADAEPTTDLVYAVAAQIMGADRVTMPFTDYPQITHMKRRVINTRSDDWTRELIWEWHQGQLRINTVAQTGCFHYHVKDWCDRVSS